MRKLLLLSLLALSVTAACGAKDQDGTAERRPAQIATVSVEELDRMLANQECQAVDANADTTRRQMGVIPGAVLLRDADSIDKLPADKTKSFVFYCANPACGASHHAANKARMAGYKHVKILSEGIAGWVKAGKKTESI